MSAKNFDGNDLSWIETVFREKLAEYEKDLPNAKPESIYQKCLLDGIRDFKAIIKKATQK